MSGFFDRIVGVTLGRMPTVRPRIAPRFAPVFVADGAELGGLEQVTEIDAAPPAPSRAQAHRASAAPNEIERTSAPASAPPFSPEPPRERAGDDRAHEPNARAPRFDGEEPIAPSLAPRSSGATPSFDAPPARGAGPLVEVERIVTASSSAFGAPAPVGSAARAATGPLVTAPEAIHRAHAEERAAEEAVAATREPAPAIGAPPANSRSATGAASSHGDGGATVHVHIGRVDVRAVMPPAPSPRPAPAPRPGLSLEKYLESRNRGPR
ncbi:MAG TPA: hypothetical protein VFF06_19970 [Polyangia bacterium]|nr:hypothetical protein [Polyangia bacterium]